MAGWNGSGTFTKTHTWVNDAANNIKIRADRHDQNDTDFQSGINNCLTKDGQNSPSANLPMNGKKHTNVANAAASNEYLAAGQYQDGGIVYGTTTGSANAYVLTLGVSITSYTAGLTLRFKANFANTGAATLDVDGLGAVTIKKDTSVDLVANDIIVDQIVQVTYDGTNFQVDIFSVELDTTPGLEYNSGKLRVKAGEGIALDASGTNVDLDTTPGLEFNASKLRVKAGTGITLDASGTNVDVGTGANQIVQLDGSAQLPALDGTNLTNLPELWSLIETQTASASSTIDFTTSINSTYYMYKIIITDVVPGTDAVNFYFRTSTDGGTSYDAGASDYAYTGLRSLSTTSSITSTGVAQIPLVDTTAGYGAGTGTGETINMEVTLYNPSSTAYTYMRWDASYRNSSATIGFSGGAGVRLSAADVDAFRFLMSSGTIASGTFKLYGLKAA